MSKRKHLIIGCGSSALAALEKIRSITTEDEVKLVTRENLPHYSPAALPYLFSGRIKEANFWMKEDDYSIKKRATIARGKQLAKVVPEDKAVVYLDGEKEQYHKLLIATGSEPIKSRVKGMERACFGGLHTMEDTKKLLLEIQDKNDVSIYGGGLVALEMAAALIERGCQVNVIVRSRILRNYFDENGSAVIRNIFLASGARIFTGSEVREVKRGKDRIEVYLDDGRYIDTDILVNALGVASRTDFLGGTNVKINKGILVDNRMRTNIEGIYAAGDVAEAPDFFTGLPVMNAILPSAVKQGKVAGANMAGEDIEYEGDISMNVFNFFGNRAISMGVITSGCSDIEIMQEEERQKNSLKILAFRNSRLVGVNLLNIDVDPGILLYLIKNRVYIDSFKEMLFEKPGDTSRWLMLQNEKGQTPTT